MKEQIKIAWMKARQRTGAAWHLVGPDLQEALAAKEAIEIIGNQVAPKDPETALTRLNEIIEFARKVLTS